MKASPQTANPLLGELESARRFLQRALAPVPEELWPQ